MPNNGWKPSRCRACKRPATDRNPVSYRGLHAACAEKRMTGAITQISRRSGPAYEKWARGQITAAQNLKRELRSKTAS